MELKDPEKAHHRQNKRKQTKKNSKVVESIQCNVENGVKI